MNPLDKRSIFTIGLRGIRMQAYQRSTEGYSCRYRSPDGLKCIAGHLIPDEHYSPDMEGRHVGNLDYFQSAVRGEAMHMLTRMQHAHDSTLIAGAEAFECVMKRIAADFNIPDAYVKPDMVSGQHLTPWYPPEVKPIRPGLYLTVFTRPLPTGLERRWDSMFSYWSGKWWSESAPSIFGAMLEMNNCSGVQTKAWRGVVR